MQRAMAGERLRFETESKTESKVRHVLQTYVPDVQIDGSVAGVFVLISNITETKQRQQQLDDLARVDTLTGLLNRRQFDEKLRETDVAARLTGDEFVVLLGGVTDAADAAQVAQKILDAMRLVFVVEGQPLKVTTSVGVAVSTHHNVPASDIMRTADAALYQAKGAGRDRFHLALATEQTGPPAAASKELATSAADCGDRSHGRSP